ncbi:hypothetical protein QYM36_012530, partial [Artemia franciscana]
VLSVVGLSHGYTHPPGHHQAPQRQRPQGHTRQSSTISNSKPDVTTVFGRFKRGNANTSEIEFDTYSPATIQVDKLPFIKIVEQKDDESKQANGERQRLKEPTILLDNDMRQFDALANDIMFTLDHLLMSLGPEARGTVFPRDTNIKWFIKPGVPKEHEEEEVDDIQLQSLKKKGALSRILGNILATVIFFVLQILFQ